MRNGFGAYYAAIHEPDVRKQAELVLLGNILLADYEQQRVDPIVRSALSLFPSRLLNDDPADPELLTVRDKKPWALQDKGRVRTWIDATYARLVTRFRMAIVLPAGRPLRDAQRADLCRGRAAEASRRGRAATRRGSRCCAIGSWSRCGTRTTARVAPIAPRRRGTGPSSATG